MYRKKLMRACLAGIMAATVVTSSAPISFAADDATVTSNQGEAKATTVPMKIRFMDGKTFVAGGDYTLPEGTQNYSILEQYVPEGYKLSVSGDFTVVDQGKLDVAIEKVQKDVVMNIRFMDGKTFVAGGDYTLPEGTQNYSVLEQYVPEGYKLSVSGDFTVVSEGSLDVAVEKVQKDVVMNIRFMDGKTFVAGGDYTLPAGTQNYSVLEQYVPEGYKLSVSGDFFAEQDGKLEVAVEKIQKDVIMNIQFKDGDEVVAGGDYTVPEGVNNYSVLEQYVPEGYKMTVTGDFFAEQDGKLEVAIEKIQKDVVMNIRFMDGDTFVAGGDYTLPEGVQNYSVLEQLVPEGYKLSVAGDFYVSEGAKLDVQVEKEDKEVVMNIQFKDGDEVVAGGDYFVPAGVQNYSVLEQYVPEGYEMTVAGDFYAADGYHLVVSVKKSTVVMNIRFMDGDTFVAGGDYFVPAGVQNYSVLQGYVPEGYVMTDSGDFLAKEDGKLDVNVEKVEKDVIMNIRFMDGDEFVAGGDYTVPEGVNNYSVLEQYVPEGYKMCVSGDFYAAEDGKLEVPVEKVEKDVIMNIRFMDGDEFVAGGDYTVPEGVNNYSVLEQYVPEGYKMCVSGDFYAAEDGKLEVPVEKIQKDVIMNIRFMDGDEFVAGGDYFVPAGVNNYSVLEQYVPEGYKMCVAGDFYAAKDGKLEVPVEKIQKDVIMNIRFMDGDTFVAGGDYFVPEGVNNYSVLEQYVPSGYKMCVAGDFMATEDGKLDVPVEKIQKNVIMNIRFMDGDEFVAGGDYFVPEGVNNYSVLEQYVPEGYRMCVSGDFMATENGKLDVPIEKIEKETSVSITFVTVDEEVVGNAYASTVSAGEEGDVYSFKLGEDFQLPEGYQLVDGMSQETTFDVPFGCTKGYKLYVEKVEESTDPTDPSDPEEPSKDNTNSNKPSTSDDKKVENTSAKTDKDAAPQTGDTANVTVPAVGAAISLAAIAAALAKKFRK